MEFTTTIDHGFKETYDKWNGKYLTEDSYDNVVSSLGVKDNIIKVKTRIISQFASIKSFTGTTSTHLSYLHT